MGQTHRTRRTETGTVDLKETTIYRAEEKRRLQAMRKQRTRADGRNDGRSLVGQMLAYDKHMNFVLAECEEFRTVKVGFSFQAVHPEYPDTGFSPSLAVSEPPQPSTHRYLLGEPKLTRSRKRPRPTQPTPPQQSNKNEPSASSSSAERRSSRCKWKVLHP